MILLNIYNPLMGITLINSETFLQYSDIIVGEFNCHFTPRRMDEGCIKPPYIYVQLSAFLVHSLCHQCP